MFDYRTAELLCVVHGPQPVPAGEVVNIGRRLHIAS